MLRLSGVPFRCTFTPPLFLTGRTEGVLFVLCCLLVAASCSKGPAGPMTGPAAPPADPATQAPPVAERDVTVAVGTVAIGSSEAEQAPAAEPGGPSTFVAEIDIPFNPDEPAVTEEQTALLDELVNLTLPGGPPSLTDEEALLLTPSELPLVMNEHVQRLIHYFTETRNGKATIRVSQGRGAAYQTSIQRILREEEVPVEIYYLAMAESGFRPKARSYRYATGMWQFISSRGKQYGLRQDRYVDLRYDAETATRAAAKHLKDLHIEFDDWYLAMAAYNCGPNRVKRAIARTGSRDFWELVRRRALPSETRNYVPIILAMTYVGKNLELFDVGAVDPAPQIRHDTVRTHVETSFALIADATGSSVDTIKDLNQGLLRSATPPYAYDLRLPPGTADQFRREIALVPPDKRLNWRRFEVRSGETLEALAKRYSVTPAQLTALNSGVPEGPLPGGLRLTVPTTTRLALYRYFGGAGGLLEPGSGRYRIASGDTLGGIARRFRTTVSKLMEWNGLGSTRIRAGRYLIVQPAGSTGTATASASGSYSGGGSPNGTYTVRRGDSLSKIGARVGASVGQLQAWNGIRGDTIHPGQRLKVPGSSSGSAAPVPSGGRYRIQRGDSLSKIASRFGVSVSNLRSWNNLRSTRITAGDLLIVKAPSSGSMSATQTASASTTTRTAASGSTANGGTTYVVRRGDTLGAIAERHNTTAAKLRAWNGIRGSMIHPGQKLTVRGTGGGSGPVTYKIQRGDTLAGIAKRFNVSVRDLQRWNSLRSSRIQAGESLRIPAAGS